MICRRNRERRDCHLDQSAHHEHVVKFPVGLIWKPGQKRRWVPFSDRIFRIWMAGLHGSQNRLGESIESVAGNSALVFKPEA